MKSFAVKSLLIVLSLFSGSAFAQNMSGEISQEEARETALQCLSSFCGSEGSNLLSTCHTDERNKFAVNVNDDNTITVAQGDQIFRVKVPAQYGSKNPTIYKIEFTFPDSTVRTVIRAVERYSGNENVFVTTKEELIGKMEMAVLKIRLDSTRHKADYDDGKIYDDVLSRLIFIGLRDAPRRFFEVLGIYGYSLDGNDFEGLKSKIIDVVNSCRPAYETDLGDANFNKAYENAQKVIRSINFNTQYN